MGAPSRTSAPTLALIRTPDLPDHPREGAPTRVTLAENHPQVLIIAQERLAWQVTNALDTYLTTDGSACILRAEHGCMVHRGARKPGAQMVTASYTGLFRSDATKRGELQTLLGD